MSLALAFSEVEADLSLVEGLTKDCPTCDEDNPRAVSRASCGACGSTGQVPLAAAEIARELHISRTEKPKYEKHEDEDDEDGDDGNFSVNPDLLLEG